MKRLLVLFLLASACGDDAVTAVDAATIDAGVADAAPFVGNATLVPAGSEGAWPAGRRDDGTAIIPGARALTPVGPQVPVGGFLLGMRLLPGGKQILLTDGSIEDEYLTVVDVAEQKVVQREPFRGRQALFLGLAVRADGHIFASGGGNDTILEYSYDPDAVAPLVKVREHPMPPSSYVAGLAFLDDRRLLVAMQTASAVMLYDTASAFEVDRVSFTGEEPYDILYSPARQEAYVSLWGAREVAILSAAGGDLTLAARVTTGKNPEGMLLLPPSAPTRLLVANAESDTVSVVDLERREVEDELEVTPPGRPQKGVVPTNLALSPDGARLYVAASGENAVDVWKIAGGPSAWARIGRIPTAWYPTSVLPLADGTVAVTAAKGWGASRYLGLPGDNTRLQGLLAMVPPQSDADLAAGTTQVEANNLRPGRVGPSLACPPNATETCRFPLPPMPGLPSPIEHVVLIQRENKTYDACLGDLAGTNGDADLAMFGEKYTPNLHALARAFANSDNFYSDAEASIQGHHWTTGGAISDFVEKTWLTTWGRATRDVALQGTNATAPDDGYYWHHLARHGVSYRSFGEIVGIAGARPDDAPFVVDTGWPGGLVFNLSSKDVDKAKYFDTWLKENELPRFSYVMLPNNHTYGLDPGKWTPEYMVSDNDEGTGRVVDSLSHSPMWRSTVIFIIEDDPADGYDHVEAHRSTLVVVSPWVRRGYVSSVHYDYASLWRTMEHLLGVPPLSQNTAVAAPMYDLFTTVPDFTPYDFKMGTVVESVNPARKRPESAMERRMDFGVVDDAPGLGQVLWRHMKGTDPPWELPWDPGDGDDDDDD